MLSVSHRHRADMRSHLPRGFGLVIAAQFASALADNALLIVTIALLVAQGLPGWWAPLLKVGFMAAYVLLAPFVGPLADAFAKGRVMAAMNGVKMLGLVALMAGLHPVVALAIVGLGAAAYAPAKYGLITELVPGEGLVAANAWIEISVVGAALLGAVLGGLLVSAAWLQACGGLGASLWALLAVYALSSLLNAFIPDSGLRRRSTSLRPRALLVDFVRANRRLWQDPQGGLSLAATTIFWGVGATLQFAVLRWAQDRLALPLDRAAYLQAAIGIGVVLGAAAAGRWVPLSRARHMLWAGVALGLLMPVVAQVQAVWLSALLLAAVGAVGGAMVVPLNALLQHRGHQLLSAGCSIAVQGFNENLSVLAMVAVYALSQARGLDVVSALSLMGLGVAAAIAALILRASRHPGLMQPR
jgi:MFS family permease